MAYRIVKETTNYSTIWYTVESNTWFGFISRLLNWWKPIKIDMCLFTSSARFKTLEEAETFIKENTKEEVKVVISEIIKEYN